jgi:transposase-like protein
MEEAEMSEQNEGRRVFTPEQRVKVVKEAPTSDLGVSGVCRKYGISSARYYHWQERFFEGAREGLRRTQKDGPTRAEQRRLDEQAKQIDRMKSVIAEITAENIDFKKTLGTCER